MGAKVKRPGMWWLQMSMQVRRDKRTRDSWRTAKEVLIREREIDMSDKVSKTAAELAKAFGYLTLGEVGAIKLIASGFSDAYPEFVNIGAGSGTSSLAMAEANPTARIITIDISDGGPLGGLENERNAFKNANRPHPIQICNTSHAAAKVWPETQKIDFLFIDDGHQEPEIRGDIEGWLPHMREGGVVAFHDYGAKVWPDVKMVVDELMLSKFDKVLHIDNVIAFKV